MQIVQSDTCCSTAPGFYAAAVPHILASTSAQYVDYDRQVDIDGII